MFEARFSAPASLLKNLADVLKEIVKEINLDLTPEGVSMQAMDSSHVSLVMLNLPASGFSHYNCKNTHRLGVSLDALTKVLRCCGNDDIVTIQHDDVRQTDTLTFLFENQRGDRISDFTIKLMDIDQELMSLPEVVYGQTPGCVASCNISGTLVTLLIR
jgi:proliferating cell nuclear antigen